MTWRLEALKALSDPNIAYILMTIGTIGIIAELYNPGAILQCRDFVESGIQNCR